MNNIHNDALRKAAVAIAVAVPQVWKTLPTSLHLSRHYRCAIGVCLTGVAVSGDFLWFLDAINTFSYSFT